MTLQEIKHAVNIGKAVYWKQDNYVVKYDQKAGWIIVCTSNGSVIGLTWTDGVTMNGKESDFYTE